MVSNDKDLTNKVQGFITNLYRGASWDDIYIYIHTVTYIHTYIHTILYIYKPHSIIANNNICAWLVEHADSCP